MSKIALIDVRMPEEAESVLAEYGYGTVRVLPAEYLPKPVASHPDMVFLPLGDQLFCHSRYYCSVAGRDTVDKVIEKTGLRIHTVDDTTGGEYPYDIRLNAAAVGTKLFCSANTSAEVKAAAEELGFELVYVKQGYTKCSVAVIGGRALITADKGIYKEAGRCGINSLLVEPGGVLLPGYDYGFIGGATGYDSGRMFFCGDVATHPSSSQIIEFCRANECEPVSLSHGSHLLDVGSIIFI